MISIVAEYQDKDLQSLDISGHAAYADQGHDIYCAAVSSVFTGGLNCLTAAPNTYRVQTEAGLGRLTIVGQPSAHDQVVLEVIVKELQDLAQTYPKYIEFKEKMK